MRRDVARGDSAAVNTDGVAHDGKAQAHAAGGCATRVVNSEEGLKQQRKRLFGHALAVVAHRKDGVAVVDAQADGDLAALPRIKQSIAHDVFNGAAEQSW